MIVVTREQIASIAGILVLLTTQFTSTGSVQAAPGQDDPPVALYRGLAALADEEGGVAEASFRQALADDPANEKAVTGLAAALLLQRKPDDAVALLEKRKAPKQSTDPDRPFILGRAYLVAGEPAKAESQFRALAKLKPDWPMLPLYLGNALYKQERFDEASEEFAKVPTDSAETEEQILLMRAVALSRAGRTDESQKLVRQVTADGLTPTLANIIRQDTVTLPPPTTASLDRTRALLKVGVQYDTNAVIAPTTNVFGLRAGSLSSPGNQTQLQIAHDLERTADEALTVSYTFFDINHWKIHEVDIQDHALALDWSKRRQRKDDPGEWLQWGVQGAYDELLVGERSFLTRVFASPYVSFIEEDGEATTLNARYQNKNFQNDGLLQNTPEERDADNTMAGVTRTFGIDDRRYTGLIGYQFDRESADGANIDYQGHRLILGAGGKMGRSKLIFNLQTQIHWRGYDNVHSFFGVQRDDDEWLTTATLAYPLDDDRTLSLELLRDRNRSNIALFDYEREVSTLAHTWRF